MLGYFQKKAADEQAKTQWMVEKKTEPLTQKQRTTIYAIAVALGECYEGKDDKTEGAEFIGKHVKKLRMHFDTPKKIKNPSCNVPMVHPRVMRPDEDENPPWDNHGGLREPLGSRRQSRSTFEHEIFEHESYYDHFDY